MSERPLKAALISLGSTSSQWTVEAMKRHFDHVDHINLKDIQINLGAREAEILNTGAQLEEYDCVYAKGSFRYADVLGAIWSKLHDKCYMPVHGEAFSVGHDKVLSHIKMQSGKVPMPMTRLTSSVEAAKQTLKEVNFPLIMKLPRGTQGKGVMVAESYASASSMLDTLEALSQPVMIQEYIDTDGEDIRAIVVGDKVVASMKRIASEGESRANIHAGGCAQHVTLDTHTQKIAVRAAHSIGAQICAVDILESTRGPVVLEVNLSPGLQGISKCTNVDIPEKIAKYLHEQTSQYVEQSRKEQTNEILKSIQEDNNEESKEIITNLDFRGNKILLPELITKITQFSENDEIVLKVKKGELRLERFM